MSEPSVPKIERHAEGVARWTTSDLAENFIVYTSLPTEAVEHRMRVLEILDSDSVPGSDLIGGVFEIGEFVVHAVPLVNEETGEELLGRRIVFPQTNGLPVAFVSEGVIKSMQRLSWAIGREPPWDPPIKVRLKQHSAKGGKRYYKLYLVKD